MFAGCSQEDFPGIHKSPRKITRNFGISRSSVRGLVKRRKINQFKRMKAPHMNNGTRDQKAIRSGRFDRNPRLVEKFAYQDEKEFILKERKTRYQTRIFSIKKISSPSK